MSKKLNVGGQAVIEGVMMRSPNFWAIAVRKPNGEIEIKKDRLNLLSEKSKFFKFPVIRGFMLFLSALILGIKALNYSANVTLEEEKEEISDWHIYLTIIIAFAIAIIVFFIAPLYITKLLNFKNYLLFNITDGLIRIIFFLGYLFLISQFKDIKRIFQYHGAEHKAIYTYENDEELTVENASKFTTLHPRCGTSFLIIVFIISIFIFSLIPKESPFWIKSLSRVVLIPLIAGISYEILKISDKYKNNFFIKIFILPGLWLQKITTKNPDKKQLEVAILALNEILKLEKEGNNAKKT